MKDLAFFQGKIIMKLRKYIMEIFKTTSLELLGYIKQNSAQIILGCLEFKFVQMKDKTFYFFTKGR